MNRKYYYQKMYEYENSKYPYEDRYICEEDWLEELSPSILEAFNEYTIDQDNKEDY